MNSADRQGKTLKPRSPWSDGNPRTSPAVRPPRTPTRYTYDHGTVTSSPAFDSLGTRTQRKREARSSNDAQSSPKAVAQKSNESSPSIPSSLLPRRLDTTAKISPQVTTTCTPEEAEKETKQGTNETSKTNLSRSRPSITSPSTASDVSSLNVSSPEFVPSAHTIFNMGIPSNRAVQCPISHVLPGMNLRRQVPRSRFPQGEELQKMIAVLLRIVETTPSNRTHIKNNAHVALYPYRSSRPQANVPSIPSTFARTTDDSVLVNKRMHHVPLRVRTRSA